MIKLALIGEDPNDTSAIRNLLSRKFKDVSFTSLLKNKRGDQLKNERAIRALQIEYNSRNPDIVIFIKDADAIETETGKLQLVIEWYNNLNKLVENKGILLMNIYELEALILADIATFNKLYKTDISYKGNVMYQATPKEFLIQKTFKKNKVYTESHCPDIFSQLDVESLCKNCQYFSKFYAELEHRYNQSK